MSAFIDISGQRFGRLVAVKVVRNKPVMWECRCDCGNIHITSRANLYKAKSCGCSHVEQARKLGREKRKSAGYSARNKLMRKYESQARYRNLEFKLTTDQFNEITKKNCFYCNKVPSQIVNIKGCNGEYIYNGIDRLDNSKGYSVENCVPCCGTCNRAKQVMSVEEFYSWIDRVYHHKHPNRLSASVSYTSGDQLWGDGTAEWYKELTELGISK